MKIKSPSFAISILVIINVLNYADRYILPAVLPKIQKDFGLTLSQEGLLGTAFLLVYGLLTVPLAIVADKTSRKKVVGFCVLLWSSITALTGFIHNFSELFIVRSLLGVGEAGYSPASLSLMGEYSTETNRAKILSLFSGGTLLGTAIGFILGSLIADYIGWRYAFFIVGIPGVITGLVCFLISEPKRDLQNTVENANTNFKIMLKRLLLIRTYWLVVVAYIFVTFAIGGTSFWLPTYLVKAYELSVGKAGTLTGGILVVSGIIGVTLGGYISDFMYRKNKRSRLLVPAIGSCIGAFFVLLALLTTKLDLFITFAFIGGIFLSSTSGPLYAVVNDVVYPSVRSTAFGISSLLSHLLGDASAPLLIGALASSITLKSALSLTTPIALSLTGIMCFIAMFTVLKDIKT